LPIVSELSSLLSSSPSLSPPSKKRKKRKIKNNNCNNNDNKKRKIKNKKYNEDFDDDNNLKNKKIPHSNQHKRKIKCGFDYLCSMFLIGFEKFKDKKLGFSKIYPFSLKKEDVELLKKTYEWDYITSILKKSLIFNEIKDIYNGHTSNLIFNFIRFLYNIKEEEIVNYFFSFLKCKKKGEVHFKKTILNILSLNKNLNIFKLFKKENKIFSLHEKNENFSSLFSSLPQKTSSSLKLLIKSINDNNFNIDEIIFGKNENFSLYVKSCYFVRDFLYDVLYNFNLLNETLKDSVQNFFCNFENKKEELLSLNNNNNNNNIKIFDVDNNNILIKFINEYYYPRDNINNISYPLSENELRIIEDMKNGLFPSNNIDKGVYFSIIKERVNTFLKKKELSKDYSLEIVYNRYIKRIVSTFLLEEDVTINDKT